MHYRLENDGHSYLSDSQRPIYHDYAYDERIFPTSEQFLPSFTSWPQIGHLMWGDPLR